MTGPLRAGWWVSVRSVDCRGARAWVGSYSYRCEGRVQRWTDLAEAAHAVLVDAPCEGATARPEKAQEAR